MAQFEPGVPIINAEPTIVVDPGAPLVVGRNVFSLVVVDDAGIESAPALIEVVVRDEGRPTAMLDLVDAAGNPIEPVVAAGAPFTLSAARSFDLAPGKIVEYRFTLLAA